MKLAPQQQEARELIMRFMQSDQKRFVLGGFAGTGKSTLAKFIEEEFEKIHHCAYTGKAANVLREKGNASVSTIHGALYTPIKDSDPVRFKLDHDSFLKDQDLVIIDEFSMLSEKIVKDIEKICKKVLYLGDTFQLPPINGDCPLVPDFFLTDIHRQALESPILRAATDVREGRCLSFQNTSEFIYQPRSFFTADDYDEAEQIIVGFNKTRTAWNNRFREKLGFAGHKFPQMGDKLICTRNNHDLGLFNGMIGYATSDARKVSFQEIKVDFDDYKDIPTWDGNFRGKLEKDCIGRDKMLNRFDYGYVITAHKSQGSEFDNVLILNQPIGSTAEERARWLYTSITRGRNLVKLIEP